MSAIQIFTSRCLVLENRHLALNLLINLFYVELDFTLIQSECNGLLDILRETSAFVSPQYQYEEVNQHYREE